MADFRKWFIALAVVALMATAASAQVGFANGSASDLLACTATAAGTPELRPEGFTDLAGDIVISCTGGPVLAQGSVVPTVNIVVYLQPSVPITSRWLASNGASEVILLVDEPGSGIKTGVGGQFGPNAPQNVCTTAQQQDNGGLNNGSSCTPTVGSAAGVDVNGNAVNYEVAVSGGAAAKNVYQGKINDFGTNTVAFYNVPVLPPATNGVRRTFRITNIRVPGSPAFSGGVTFLLNAFLSASPSAALPISGGGTALLNIGVLGKPSGATVTSMQSFLQCQDQVRAQSANIVFTEGFATAFKTRVVPMTNTQWASQQTNLATQNIPGGLYGGFAANSESGLIMSTLTGSTGGNTYVAGLADFGTRLKAVFVNVPTGISLYVSQSNLTSNVPAPPGGTSVFSYAVLVSTGTSDSTIDQTGGVVFTGGSTSFPITSSLNGTNTGGGSQPVVALAANNGVYTATWEVVNSNPSAIDVLTFGVYITYTAAAPTNTNPYGTPITDLPPGAPIPTVFMTLAPEPGGGGSFNTTTNFSVLGTPIPRFANLPNSSGRWIAVNLCQTTLLYPYVTGAAGFDTGIAVANTSLDPWGTRGQSGSCTLYAYGVTVAAAGNTHFTAVINGCDALTGATPAPGTNCFDRVPAGEVGYINASTGPTGPGPLQNFQGYVIAICNFQYAHGYAAVTDLGLRNLWSSYLALELNPCTGTPGTACVPGTVGSPRKGVQSIEILVH